MCGIIASYDKDKLKELILLNQQRGSFSHSLMIVSYKHSAKPRIYAIHKEFGEFDLNLLDDFDDCYFIAHVQAPTNGMTKDPTRIHPSQIDSSYLYHNGIIQNSTLDKISKKYNISSEWDTKLLHYSIYYNIKNINDINGSFACLYKHHEFYIFRNSMCILYYDNNLNISSEKFENSIELPANQLFLLDIQNKKIIPDMEFIGEQNYFFG